MIVINTGDNSATIELTDDELALVIGALKLCYARKTSNTAGTEKKGRSLIRGLQDMLHRRSFAKQSLADARRLLRLDEKK